MNHVQDIFNLKEAETLLTQFIEIPAPTFQEKKRSDFILKWLHEHVSSEAQQDELGNVWVDLSGHAERVVLFDAHIDTVFPHPETSVRKEKERWYGLGIFDDGAACILQMLYARNVVRAGRKPPVLISFTVGEEGLGNLRGIRAIVDRFKPRLRAGFALDLGLESGAFEAVGSLRYELQWTAEGGHSWNNFGHASAIHEASQWIEKLRTAFPWKCGELSFNVGTISGGSGVNVIAENATLTLDLRSVSAGLLQTVEQWMQQQAYSDKHVELKIKQIGGREAGKLSEEHALVRCLNEVHHALKLPLTYSPKSTNANAIVGAGIPGISTGLANGGNTHTEGEYLLPDSLEIGYRKLQMLEQKLNKIL